ncbi:MAG: asparagine synthase (glutamine-hydrolyzing) [Planctomycetes bacterium]|nr:asparagine synthase (glutamine-hydrolyzing) [Planctomycetota bacterium]
MSVDPLPFLDDPSRLNRAIDTLAHRGPDDRGVHVLADRRAFLGHRRLSIIDLGGGHQPISNETGDIRLCYNGEIYNYRELQPLVTQRGHRLATSTDGEPALHLYEDDPAGFQSHLAGMFALAVLDEQRNELSLTRDRLGIKPLVYYFDGRTILFASEIKAILALLPKVPAINASALRQYLRWKYVPWPLTIYENIFKLPPAHTLTVRQGGGHLTLETRPYWQLNYGAPSITNEAAAIDELDALLRDAVKSHLASDVEVGALLSGGVDSSLVVALASTVSNQRIKTFSVGFDEAGFDQLPFARTLATRYNTEHVEEIVRLDPMETVARLARQFDEPFADSSALACLRVCEVASKRVKVVLTGDGGDETFAGYNRYQEIVDAHAAPSAIERFTARAVIASSSALFSPEAKYLRRFRAKLLTHAEQHRVHQYLCSDWLCDRILMPRYAQSSRPDEFDGLRRMADEKSWRPLQAAQYVDVSTYLPEDILMKVDRTSMACSLECRVPLLDHRVTEFSARLSDELKIRGGVRKYLLKKVAERYVPHELLYRPKMGFRIPIRRWFKRDLLEQTSRLLVDGALMQQGILNPVGVQWMLSAQRRPWIDFGSQLWALLMMEQWARVNR